MRTSFHCFSLLLVVFTATLIAEAQQVTPFTGTWKLNVSKSTYPPAMAPRNFTLQFAPDGKTSGSGTMADGKPFTWSFPRSDGKEVPVQGDIGLTEKSTFSQVIRGNTCDSILRSAGKIVMKVHATVSPDGKTQTGMVTVFDERGHQGQHKEVYEKL